LINDYGFIYKSTDAGSSWTKLSFDYNLTSVRYSYFNQLFFIDESIGYACYTSKTDNYGIIYQTKDGGSSWDKFLVGSRYIQFVDHEIGYAIKDANSIYKTTDGGASWTEYEIGINDYLKSLNFIDKNTGYAVGILGSIMKTQDGGVTWIFQKSNIAHTLSAISVDDSDNNCIAVGTNATILKSDNGGMEWEAKSIGPPIDFRTNTISFSNHNTAFAMGNNNLMMKTMDGGITWMPYSLDIDNTIHDLHFVDANIGYAVGLGGFIMKTIDGGDSWTELVSGTTIHLNKIYALNKDVCFVMGDKSNVYKTADGGMNWTNLSQEGNAMVFVNDSMGFMVDLDDLYKTTDQGDTWKTWDYPDCWPCIYGDNDHILFTDSVLIIGGSDIWRSLDTGKTWTNVELNRYINSMHFSNSLSGYLLTDGISILNTVDGGYIWEEETYRLLADKPTNLSFSCCNALAGGQSGRIFKPTNPIGIATAINEIKWPKKKAYINIFPNPTIGLFEIKTNSNIVSIEVYDVQGKLIISKLLDRHSTSQKLDLSGLSEGIYSCLVKCEKGIISQKVIKCR